MITLPSLDDRTFADFFAEARAKIPALAPTWTDHNPSDPGIILVELFAWLSEIVLYRIDQVPERTYRTFLRLLRGDDLAGVELTEAIRTTIRDLRERDRAITADDFEYLALHRFPAIARARCYAEQSPDKWLDPTKNAEGHYTVVVVPAHAPLQPSTQTDLAAFFDERRLLTTTVHLVECRTLAVSITADLYLEPDGPPDVRGDAMTAIKNFIDPLTGFRGAGWPFGRPVYASDVAAILDGVPGVDFVDNVKIAGASQVALAPDQLPDIDEQNQPPQLTLYRRRGARWQAL